MKNKNIVHDKNKKTPFYQDKRGILVVILLLLLFCLTAISMPMASIPLLGRMGSILGLNDDSMRALTLTDFAAYTFGVEGGGRLASVRNAQYSVYESSGGLSPFGVQNANRLLDAKQAYMKEFEKMGRYNAIAGSAGGLDVADPGAIGVGGAYLTGNGTSPYIDPITGAAAADAYGQPFVKPLDGMALDEAYAESSQTGTDGKGTLVLRGSDKSKILKPSGTSKIMSARSDPNNVYVQALDNKAKKLNGGRLGAFGGINAMTSRVSTSIGAGRQMNVFGAAGRSMGRVYYLSAVATGQKYNDVAKNVVEAAWDGGEIENEDLIAQGEEAEKVLNSLEPPSNIIEKANGARGACQAARAAYDESLNNAGKEFKKDEIALNQIAENKIPGNCKRPWLHPNVIAKRAEWNGKVASLSAQCNALRTVADKYSGICGLNYQQNVSCSELNQLKLIGNASFWRDLFGSCRNRPRREDNKSGISKEEVANIISRVRKGAGLDGTTNENFF